MGFSEVSREEEIVHELGRLLEGCSDLELIEKSFIESVGRLTAARSVQWIRGPVHPSSAGDGDGDGRLEIMLRTGSVARTTARPAPFRPAQRLAPATVKRLKTLCTMAASALLRHDRQNAELSQPAGRDLEPIPNALAIASARTDRDLDKRRPRKTTLLPRFSRTPRSCTPFSRLLWACHGVTASRCLYCAWRSTAWAEFTNFWAGTAPIVRSGTWGRTLPR